MAKPMWMVRAGENGYLFDDFHTNNYCSVSRGLMDKVALV